LRDFATAKSTGIILSSYSLSPVATPRRTRSKHEPRRHPYRLQKTGREHNNFQLHSMLQPHVQMEVDHKLYGIAADGRNVATDPTIGVYQRDDYHLCRGHEEILGKVGAARPAGDLLRRDIEEVSAAIPRSAGSHPSTIQYPTNVSEGRAPLRDSLRDLFTGFGVGFDS
jgi:hypothetical protein